jgi:hypothetical protein
MMIPRARACSPRSVERERDALDLVEQLGADELAARSRSMFSSCRSSPSSPA